MTSAVAHMLIIIGCGEINWEVDFFLTGSEGVV